MRFRQREVPVIASSLGTVKMTAAAAPRLSPIDAMRLAARAQRVARTQFRPQPVMTRNG